MPEICRFLGMIITMYMVDHAPPHFHVRHGKFKAIIDISTGKLLKGKLPRSALKSLEEWRKIHLDELMENWQRREQGKPLAKIPALKHE
jgi:hypothetical protein